MACPSDPWEICEGARVDFVIADTTTPDAACAAFYRQVEPLIVPPMTVTDDTQTVTDESATFPSRDAFLDLCAASVDQRGTFTVTAPAEPTALTDATVEATLRAPDPYKVDSPTDFAGVIRAFGR